MLGPWSGDCITDLADADGTFHETKDCENSGSPWGHCNGEDKRICEVCE